ncbi:MAG TPA: FKBP-type peptidyl-prolyl cis-trans isomerase [Pseudomonadales bacterium]|nr:FKBP-type peptidyl-prolyl cis-trans isomerase [Pseudomonadales bacterium]
MKKTLTLAMMLAIPTAFAAEHPAKLETDAQKASYAVGYRFGSSLQRDASDLDVDAIQKGFLDGFQKKQAAVAEDQQQQAIMNYQQNRMNAAVSRNSEAAKKFFAENGKKSGVTTLPDGLQYEVIKAGNGASPKKTDRVKVHYHGTLLNGQVFDSSVQRGEPATFQVGEVIQGWVEALQKMKVGDKWKLYIPADLAYGNRGMGPIEPGSALVFEVELLDILPAEEAKKAADVKDAK